jgi:branched-chain amino acid transport system substrate-binding protein
MKTKKLLARISVIFFVLALLTSIGPLGLVQESEAKTLKIGSVWGLTGPGSEFGLLAKNGEALCKDWINAKGGITVKGEKYLIEIVTEDIKATAEGAVTAANKLVYQDKVKFILGLAAPFQVDAVASVTEPNKVAYFAAIHDNVSPRTPYTVSAMYGYGSPKPVVYDYLHKTYPLVKKVAFTEIDEPAVQKAADAARAEIKKLGLTDVGNVKYPFGTQDYYAILNKVLTYKPDALDINMEFPGGAAAIAKQARELGFTGPILGNSPWDPVFVRDKIGSKEYATDFVIPAFEPVSAAADLPAITKKIVQLWVDTYKVPFVADSLHGWDPVQELAQAIEAAQSFDSGDVIKAFQKMKTIECSVGSAKVGGLKTYGINNMVVQPCPLTVLKNGEVKFVGFMPLNIP